MAAPVPSAEAPAANDASADTFEWFAPDSDEEVVWAGQPHLVSEANRFIWGLLTLPLLGFGLLLIVPAYLKITKTDFVVTTTGVYERRGILTERIENLDHDRIQNTRYEQSFLERQLGIGSVGISTAGSSGDQITLNAIEDAREVQDLIGKLGVHQEESDPETSSAVGGDLEDLAAELRATREALESVAESLRE